MALSIQMTVALFSIAIAIGGLIVSFFAYRNATQTRKENQAHILFKLKLDALEATKDVEITWQNLSNQLSDARLQITSAISSSPSLGDLLSSLDEMNGFVRDSLDTAKTIAARFEEHFDSYSVEKTTFILRKTLKNKITLAQCQETLRRKLNQLESLPFSKSD